MTDLFLKVLSMSMSASILAAAVILARLLLKKAPRWLTVAMWGLVALRLICPFTIETTLSRVPQAISSGEMISQWTDDYVGDIQIIYDSQSEFHTAVDAGRIPVSAGNEGEYVVTAPDMVSPPKTIQNTVLPILSRIWISGTGVMLLFSMISYIRLKNSLRMAILVRQDIYLSEFIDSPFVLGILKPRIYLPYHMKKLDRHHVIAHERTHIRRKDHWWKPLGYLLLSIHWFNPILWVSYVLLCRDIEIACDQQAIRNMKPEQRANYSQALLNCAAAHRYIAACPVAFGEIGIKTRVSQVLKYKKPALWVVTLSVLLCITIAVCFMTSPKTQLPFLEQYIGILHAESFDLRSSDTFHRELTGTEREELSLHLLDLASVSPYRSDTGNSIIPLWYVRADLVGLGELRIEGISRDGNEVLLTFDDQQYMVQDDDFAAYLVQLCTGQTTIADSPESTLTMGVENISPISVTLVFDVQGALTSEELICDSYYTLEKLDNEQWTAVQMLSAEYDAFQSTETFPLPENLRITENWSWLYGDLPPGTYRIGKTVKASYPSDVHYELFAIFNIEESDIPALMPDSVSHKVCVGIISTEIGTRQYAIIPDQDAAKAAFESAMAAVVSGVGWNGEADKGILVTYQGQYLYLTGGGNLMAFDGRIPGEFGKALYDLALDTAKQVGWQEAVTPDQIRNLQRATLRYYGVDVMVEDETRLNTIENMLSNAHVLYGGAGCPFGCLLTLETEDGETIRVSMAADSCAAYMSNGVYYDYGSDNTEFYSLFSNQVIHEKLPEGIEAMQPVFRDMNWNEYDSLYHAADTLALMDALRDWVLAEPNRERITVILNLTSGLDGAYAEYYSQILKMVYQADPAEFAAAYFGDTSDSIRSEVVLLLSGSMQMDTADVKALLETNAPA